MQLFFVTTNLRKFEEIESIFKFPIKILEYEIQEIQGTKEEIVIDKLKKACTQFEETYIIVDDASVEIDGLFGFPGPYGKDFLKIGEKAINTIVSKVGRSCKASCILAFGYIDAKREFKYNLFEGVVSGQLAEPRKKGFKYDSMFLPEGSDRVYAEMSIREKTGFSHRGIACKKLMEFLEENYNFDL